MHPDCSPIEKKGNKNVWCDYYDDCLDYAVDNSWKYWDCGNCTHQNRQESRLAILLKENSEIDYYEIPKGISANYLSADDVF